MHSIDAQKAGLAVGRGLFAFADLDRRGPGLFIMAAQAVARSAAQVVEVAVGKLRQPLELGLAVDLELALENMPRGRAAQALVRLINGGQQFDVCRGVMALEAGPPEGLAAIRPSLEIAANQPRGLRPAEARSCARRRPAEALWRAASAAGIGDGRATAPPSHKSPCGRNRQTAHSPRPQEMPRSQPNSTSLLQAR